MNIRNKKILLIVAHPDDETFGCGGLIKKLSKNKNTISAISFTNGVNARDNQNEKDIKIRENSSLKASKILGFNWIAKYNLPDNRLDKISLLEIVKLIEKHKKNFKPHVVLTHNFSDLNIDHRKIAEATITAFRPEPNQKLEQLITFEVPSVTEYRILQNQKNFIPNYFVNIEKFVKYKIEASKCYYKELKKYPHPRSLKAIQNLCRYRGSQSGFKFAEAFEIIRNLEK